MLEHNLISIMRGPQKITIFFNMQVYYIYYDVVTLGKIIIDLVHIAKVKYS